MAGHKYQAMDCLMFKIKRSLSESVSKSMTRSPIELFWTSKNGIRDACSTADIFNGLSSGPVVVPTWSTSDLSVSYLISPKLLLFENIANDGSFQYLALPRSAIIYQTTDCR